MKIGINASFIRKPNTGIGQVSVNFLRKLINIKYQISNIKNTEITFILYLEEDLPRSFKLPKNFEKYYQQYKTGDITGVEFAKLLQVSRATLYRNIKEYEQ